MFRYDELNLLEQDECFKARTQKSRFGSDCSPQSCRRCLIVASPARAANVQILELGGKAFELRAKPASWAILDLNKFGLGAAQIFKGFQKNEVWTFAIESTHVVHPKNSSLPSCQSGQAFVWHVTVNE